MSFDPLGPGTIPRSRIGISTWSFHAARRLQKLLTVRVAEWRVLYAASSGSLSGFSEMNLASTSPQSAHRKYCAASAERMDSSAAYFLPHFRAVVDHEYDKLFDITICSVAMVAISEPSYRPHVLIPVNVHSLRTHIGRIQPWLTGGWLRFDLPVEIGSRVGPIF
jgi:hypothetical protein